AGLVTEGREDAGFRARKPGVARYPEQVREARGSRQSGKTALPVDSGIGGDRSKVGEPAAPSESPRALSRRVGHRGARWLWCIEGQIPAHGHRLSVADRAQAQVR